MTFNRRESFHNIVVAPSPSQITIRVSRFTEGARESYCRSRARDFRLTRVTVSTARSHAAYIPLAEDPFFRMPGTHKVHFEICKSSFFSLAAGVTRPSFLYFFPFLVSVVLSFPTFDTMPFEFSVVTTQKAAV